MKSSQIFFITSAELIILNKLKCFSIISRWFSHDQSKTFPAISLEVFKKFHSKHIYEIISEYFKHFLKIDIEFPNSISDIYGKISNNSRGFQNFPEIISKFCLLYPIFLQSPTTSKHSIFPRACVNCHHRLQLGPHKYVWTMHNLARSTQRIMTASDCDRIADHVSVLGPSSS